MVKMIKHRSKKAGLSPGSIVYVGKEAGTAISLSMIDYDDENCRETRLKKIEDFFPSIDSKTIKWINIDGIHDTSIIEKMGERFNIHSLILEDILNTYQRPKIEFFDDYIVIIIKMISFDSSTDNVESEQISIIGGANYVATFQEKQGDVFDPLRERIRSHKGIIRSSRPEFLCYSLLDAIIDNYFIVLENIGEKIEILEEELMDNADSATLNRIYKLKREILSLRKYIWPVREIIKKIDNMESFYFTTHTKSYFRDLYDHTIQVIDSVETFRDMISGMLDLYLSSISHRMNQVMKVLTIIATIFIPLTFIAGIYGMNFEYMPELKWPFGYFGILGIMALTALVMVLYFKKKEWL